MEDKGSFKPTMKCNILHVGPYRIRCMTLLQGGRVSFPPPLANVIYLRIHRLKYVLFARYHSVKYLYATYPVK